MTTLSQLYRSARTRLTEAGVEAAALDARLIVEHFTGTTPGDLICSPSLEMSAPAEAAVGDAIARRLCGEPVHRILGYRDFYGLRLKLSAGTLEPRPDTETLVDAVLPLVKQQLEATGACRILDLGTGTGAIALALLHQAAGATALGTDISEDALATAYSNAESNGLAGRFTALRSDWFAGVRGEFDLVVSNPPYIPSGEIAALAREVRDFDPLGALDGGADGLAPYRILAESGAGYLTATGAVAVEIGYRQRPSVTDIFERQGFRTVEFFKDLGGNDRVILFQIDRNR